MKNIAGDLGGNKTTKYYVEWGLEGLDEVQKFWKMVEKQGIVKTVLPEVSWETLNAYSKTLPKGPTTGAAVGLSAALRALEEWLFGSEGADPK